MKRYIITCMSMTVIIGSTIPLNKGQEVFTKGNFFTVISIL